jgi:hypothetical protein
VGRREILGKPPFLAVKLIHLLDKPAGVTKTGTQTVELWKTYRIDEATIDFYRLNAQ